MVVSFSVVLLDYVVYRFYAIKIRSRTPAPAAAGAGGHSGLLPFQVAESYSSRS